MNPSITNLGIQEKMGGITGHLKFTLENIHTGKKEVIEYDNLIVTVGKVAIARRLGNIGLLANEGMITYGATGTDGTAPLVTDTVLGTELARKVLSTTSYASNKITLRTFFNAAESVGTLLEFALFGEAATGAADSGTMYNHANINIVKSNVQTLTVEVVITVN